MLALVVVVAFTACKSKKDKEPEEPVLLNSEFPATVQVEESEDATYTQNSVKMAVFTSDSIENAVDIYLYEVSFSEKMPMKLDVIVPSVLIDEDGNLSANDIVPLWNRPDSNQPMDKYVVTNLEGKLSENNGIVVDFSLSLNFGPYPTTITMEK